MTAWTSAVAATSPYFWYQLNEASGTTAADSSGNGRTGTYNTTAGITYAQASLIPGDAGGSSITITSNTASNVSNTSVSFNRRAVTQCVTVKSSTDNTSGSFFNSSSQSRLTIQASQFLAEIGSASVALAYDPTNLFDGNAHLLMWVCGTTYTHLWVDGVKVATGTHSDAGATMSVARMKGASVNPASGQYDDYVLWDSALSDSVAVDIYNGWAGTVAPVLSLAGTLRSKTAAITLGTVASASLTGTLQAKTAAITLGTVASASLAGTLQAKSAAITLDVAEETVDLEVAGTLRAKTAEFTLLRSAEAELAGTLQAKSGAFTLGTVAAASLAGTLQSKSGAFALDVPNTKIISLSGTLRRKTGSVTVKVLPYLALNGVLRAKTGAFFLAKPSQTDTHNRLGGLHLSGYGVHSWTPPVVEPPATLAPEMAQDVLLVHSEPELTEGRQPVFATTMLSTPKHRDRVLVGGKDITFWRGVHTPTPDYSLIDPLSYGSGSLSLPQVFAAYERLGEGALSFLAKGKPVRVQRVDPDTGTVVATDYRGLIADYDLDGNDCTLILAGEAAGRMATRWHPVPVFKSRSDVGRLLADSLRKTVLAAVTPRLGPTTGIRVTGFGGMWELEYHNQAVALAVDTDGNQWTTGRRDNGTWGAWQKDRETIHATVYFDDAMMKPSLKQSIGEEVNRVFATAVAKDGRRINFRVFPGLKQGEAPDYPFADNHTFGEGTTDAETDSGDAITAMVHRMIVMGWLSREDGADYLYDADVTRALKSFQRENGMAVTGNVNVATWRGLWDLDKTGYSLGGATTLPAVQTSATRMWNRTGSGALSTRNPNYDPHVQPVDLPIDMGVNFTRQQVRQWAREKLSPGGEWIGTVTTKLSFVRGEHNPGDAAPVEADIMGPREIRPGMNIWAPHWYGGTLFHVSGVDVRDRGREVTVALDTQARNTMEAWEVITRNRESRKNLNRAWLQEHRASTLTKDSIGPWDDISGLIDTRVRLKGNRWTVFPVVAGEEGEVRSLRIRTNPDERFAMAIFGREISEEWIRDRVPAPLSNGGSERWDKPAIRAAMDRKVLLYTAGQYQARLGYWPGTETGDDGDPSGDPVTGKWEDDSGFSFHTFKEPVLYVAIWVEDDTALPAGRLMWNQLEEGA